MTQHLQGGRRASKQIEHVKLAKVRHVLCKTWYATRHATRRHQHHEYAVLAIATVLLLCCLIRALKRLAAVPYMHAQ